MKPQKLMGYENPGDEKVPVSVRDWNAQKLALWRSRGLSEIVAREAEGIISRCRHLDNCLGADNESEPCFPDTLRDGVIVEGCADREMRMSALVILNAARQLAPENARRPADERFFAPSREYYSEVMATLAATQIENEMLRSLLKDAGIAVPEPMATSGNSNAGGAPPALKEAP